MMLSICFAVSITDKQVSFSNCFEISSSIGRVSAKEKFWRSQVVHSLHQPQQGWPLLPVIQIAVRFSFTEQMML